MKRIILYTFGAILLATVLVSCEKELMNYTGKDGIYFDTDGMIDDTVSVHWGLKNSEVTEQTIDLKVLLIGNVADHDRSFNV